MGVFDTFKIKIETKILIRNVPKASDNIQVQFQTSNPSQEPRAFSKAPNQDLKDMDVLCNFIIKIESQNLEYGCTKDK